MLDSLGQKAVGRRQNYESYDNGTSWPDLYFNRLDKKHSTADKTYLELATTSLNPLGSGPSSGANEAAAASIYYHRENAIYSSQNRRIDLITITGLDTNSNSILCF